MLHVLMRVIYFHNDYERKTFTHDINLHIDFLYEKRALKNSMRNFQDFPHELLLRLFIQKRVKKLNNLNYENCQYIFLKNFIAYNVCYQAGNICFNFNK